MGAVHSHYFNYHHYFYFMHVFCALKNITILDQQNLRGYNKLRVMNHLIQSLDRSGQSDWIQWWAGYCHNRMEFCPQNELDA